MPEITITDREAEILIGALQSAPVQGNMISLTRLLGEMLEIQKKVEAARAASKETPGKAPEDPV